MILLSFELLCGPKDICPRRATPLYWVSELKELEALGDALSGNGVLMRKAGLAVAQLALAIAPHAQRIWIPCGPGNNGGDGLEAAFCLLQMGKTPIVTMLRNSGATPADAQETCLRARHAGVIFEEQTPPDIDLCIDALFGIGTQRPFDQQCITWIAAINALDVPVLAVDIPTGLASDSGIGASHLVKASHTLTLLGAKPGLFMVDGRDACGEIWLHSLEVPESAKVCAVLNTIQSKQWRPHNSHKGSFGDVGVIGGARGMGGAAVLAASAALRSGAGRVYLGMLCADELFFHPIRPELMLRDIKAFEFESMSVVTGCGGGDAIQAELESIIRRSYRLVLDADALNCLANSNALEQLLTQRERETTVLTPHPLEAARLLGVSVKEIQNNRILAAQRMAMRFRCTVVLKGSGTVIADGVSTPYINVSGNARLATGGTGDVLAGILGANLAAGTPPFEAACLAVNHHGSTASVSVLKTLPAQELVDAI